MNYNIISNHDKLRLSLSCWPFFLFVSNADRQVDTNKHRFFQTSRGTGMTATERNSKMPVVMAICE